MKKSFLSLVLLLLLVAVPVMATPKTKIIFASQVTLTAGNDCMGQQSTENGILYVSEAISTGIVIGDAVSGSLLTELSGVGDLATGLGSFRGKFEIANAAGFFEGRVNGIVTAISQSKAEVSGSFIGFGSGGYAKQKIKGVFEGSVEYGTLQVELSMTGLLTGRKT